MLIDKKEWIEKTGGHSPKRRSEALECLDDAIGMANKIEMPAPESAGKLPGGEFMFALSALALVAVDTALKEWMAEQEKKHFKGWRGSVRNAKGAVEDLVKELHAIRRSELPHEVAALAAVKAARDASIPDLFKGCKCISRASSRDLLNDTISTVSSVASGAELVQGIRRAAYSKDAGSRAAPTAPAPAGRSELRLPDMLERGVNELVQKAFGASLAQLVWDLDEKFYTEVTEAALASIREELMAAVPVLGLVSAGAVLAYACQQAALAHTHIQAVERLHQRVVPGDSKSALAAIHRWQLSDMQLLKTRAVRATLNVGSQIAGIASGGALSLVQGGIGIGSAIMGLVDVIMEVGRQYQESRMLTRYLNGQDGQHPLGPEIFSAAPLAGAYYLLNTPASHVALQFVDIGALGWREEAERLTLHEDLAKARAEAARLIDVSRYRIVPPGGGRFIETVDKTLARRLKGLG